MINQSCKAIITVQIMYTALLNDLLEKYESGGFVLDYLSRMIELMENIARSPTNAKR